MRTLTQQRFSGTSRTLAWSDISVSESVFEACFLNRSEAPNWAQIRNAHLRDVTNINCSISAAKIENSSLHNMQRKGRSPLFLWGCVFRHVTLSGKISALKINRWSAPGDVLTRRSAWDSEIKQFYEDVDWALDISKAKFQSSVSFEAVPGDKILRDPDTQALVSRNSLQGGSWKCLDLGSSGFELALAWFLEDSLFDSVILAARTGAKECSEDLEAINKLRRAGIAS